MLINPRFPVGPDDCKIHSLSFANRLNEAFRSAHSRIWICSFVMFFKKNSASSDIKNLIDVLGVRFNDDGLDVRFAASAIRRSALGTCRHSLSYAYLDSLNIPFRMPFSSLSCHAKCIIVDNDLLFIGSHNLYDRSFSNPMELSLEVKNPFLVNALAVNFSAWWKSLCVYQFRDGVTWPA